MGLCDHMKRCIAKDGNDIRQTEDNVQEVATIHLKNSASPKSLFNYPDASEDKKMQSNQSQPSTNMDGSLHDIQQTQHQKKYLKVRIIEKDNDFVAETFSTAQPATTTDQNQKRIQWSSPVEFLLTCIGYSVGLGNVWRFPYLCYTNGGGAFLIPYSLMILTIGMPLLFMEYSFGQYFGIGSLSIFKQVCPLFQGIGIGYSILNGLVGIYYNVIIAMSIYYMFSSFSSTLPWSHCNNTWNTEFCDDKKILIYKYAILLQTVPGLIQTLLDSTAQQRMLSLMGETSENDISNLGHVRWALCLCLLLSWVLVALFVSQGIKSSGKVSYFTATFPYIMLTVLVVLGATLEGAGQGLWFFIWPKWYKLADPEVWFRAATQLFYSLNLAWGGMITMSSYNVREHNCYRDAIVINIVSFATSMYAGLAVFSVIGHMAHESHQSIENVVKSGPGLAFIAYPHALSLMPIPQLWSVLFFFMLFLLGIGSQMVCVETIMTGIMDTWRFLVVKWQYRIAVITIVCLIGFLLGIPCTAQGGMYVLQLMDQYSAGFCVLVIAIVECLVINWIYGDKKMSSHVKNMLGTKLNPFMRICWKFISPFLILVILIFSLTKYKGVTYAEKTYPLWAELAGWLMTLASNLPIIVVAIFIFINAKGSTLREKWTSATQAQVDEDSSERRHKESIYLNLKRDIGRETTMFSCDINDDVMLGPTEDATS
ncbi:hypothetical protein HELRODRAFT_189063 [Helobdella robusta]|uniref:Transporter n=1 Tax=Helobdella robusta TaxID=6412 RepID=T1FQL9_HELRO|nr:hypothetical protein HELRODRAFT_189063 [Helobdella robusta]ESN96006.1 hypothetical protein HELRODRAFT_189063 [Helobdella robusta]